MDDTIAAISTALGIGAISIIRISGDEAISIVNKIFDRDLSKVDSHTIHYGHIIDKSEIIDEVLISVMRSPRTFTKEDIVEINCHGGINTTNRVLELLLRNGTRLAEPGEFTKRAFLNGRIDLTQADGIMNLISAKTDIARKLSISQLNGNSSNQIKELRSDLVDIISNIEVNIDYPEYEDIEVLTNDTVIPKVKKIKEKILKILKEAEDGKIINNGINIGIIGKPNVGKSSLLNALLEEEKAIVTNIEGTTRDIVEGTIIVNGIVCNFIDTAGIRKTENIVEKIGVTKSIEIMNSSDLIIMVLNNNEEITMEELDLLKQIKNKNHIVVLNKIDLDSKINLPSEVKYIPISIKDNKGLVEIKEEISKIFNLEKINTTDMTYLSNARSISLLNLALNEINQSIDEINNMIPIDLIENYLKEAWNYLGEIIGETYSDELIDNIFSRFCLGK